MRYGHMLFMNIPDDVSVGIFSGKEKLYVGIGADIKQQLRNRAVWELECKTFQNKIDCAQYNNLPAHDEITVRIRKRGMISYEKTITVVTTVGDALRNLVVELMEDTIVSR